MKTLVNIARVLVGALFIFSGLVKAIDPLGLAYKMQEFFEVWARDGYLPSLMNWFYAHALLFSVIMIALEVVLGVALFTGRYIRAVSWLLLLLMLFFTFLTSYVLFSGKIRACGCFGDCIPLSPQQTFTKDIILLLLVILILARQQLIAPLFPERVALGVIVLSLAAVAALQWYVLSHLPLKDCLPYKIGNNISELRKMPANAIPDKYDYSFSYAKNGETKHFDMNNLPDSTWEFVERKQVLVQKGSNNVPLINDFSLKQTSELLQYKKDTLVSTFEPSGLPDSTWTYVDKSSTSTDVTEAILSHKGPYYLLFINDVSAIPANWDTDLKVFVKISQDSATPIMIVTANYNAVVTRYANINGRHDDRIIVPEILTADITTIRTAARNNVTLFLMDGPVIKNKWGGNDIGKAIE